MIQEFRHDLLVGFAGLPVFQFSVGDPADVGHTPVPDDVEEWAWRLGADDYDGPSLEEIFEVFLGAVDTTRVRALVLGYWAISDHEDENAAVYLETLVAAADRFPALEALFIGDMSQDQNEVSWINQSDPGPVLAAFPALRVLGVRGGSELTLEPFTHDRLEELVFQAGGLPPAVVRALGTCRLPALTRLDLYLGTQNYSGGATAEDLSGILAGEHLPALRHLGLRNAENADDVAAAVADAPVVARLETLDLSLGTLGDEGAEALLTGQPLSHLKTLDLHHHFMTDAMIQRLWEALPDVDVVVDEQLEPESPWQRGDAPFRYVAVSE